jgi:hypothetical protein
MNFAPFLIWPSRKERAWKHQIESPDEVLFCRNRKCNRDGQFQAKNAGDARQQASLWELRLLRTRQTNRHGLALHVYFEQAAFHGIFQNFAKRFVAERRFDEVGATTLQRELYV